MKLENIKYEVPTVKVIIEGKAVLVKEYLPTKDKSNMLEAIKEYCFNESILDQPKIDAIFNVLIVLNYTDIEFEFKNEYELLDFYDYMEINNYIIPIINSIPEIEYNALLGYYKSTVSDFDKFKTSGVALFANLVEQGPALMEKIGEVSKEIDIEALTTLAKISGEIN